MNLVFKTGITDHRYYNVSGIKTFKCHPNKVKSQAQALAYNEGWDTGGIEFISLTDSPLETFLELNSHKVIMFMTENSIYCVSFEGFCYITKPDSMKTVDKF